MISPELLRRFSFFADFSHEELKQLAMLGEERWLNTGQILFGEGEHAAALYFLVEGEVEIMLALGEPDLALIPLSAIPAGEMLGWSALIEPRFYTASAQVARPSRVIAFDGVEMEQIAAANPHFCSLIMRKLAQTISGRLKDTRTQLLSLTAHAVEG